MIRAPMGYVLLDVQGWPTPTGHTFIDRVDGQRYLFSHNSSTLQVELNPKVPGAVRPVDKEPLLQSPIGVIRVYVSGGNLSYEMAGPLDQRTTNNPVWTLNMSDRKTTCQLTADAVSALGDPLTLECRTIGGAGPVPGPSIGGLTFKPNTFVPGVFK